MNWRQIKRKLRHTWRVWGYGNDWGQRLPEGITPGVCYYVAAVDERSFVLSTTEGTGSSAITFYNVESR